MSADRESIAIDKSQFEEAKAWKTEQKGVLKISIRKNGKFDKPKETRSNRFPHCFLALQPEITEALLQLKEISSSYCKTSKFIQSKLLWDVVAESSYDAVLVDMIQRDISGTAPLSTATSAFQMN